VSRTYLIFGDIEGKLDVLRVECTKCARKGRYSVRRLIEKYGRKANMMKWRAVLRSTGHNLISAAMMFSLLIRGDYSLYQTICIVTLCNSS